MDEEELLKIDLDILADEPLNSDTLHPPKKYDQLPVQVEVVFGRTILPLGQLGALTPGALLPFDQSEDEGVEIYANGTLIARGEIVAVGERFGTRITSFIKTS